MSRDKIIVALDGDSTWAIKLANELKGHAVWLKVGMTLYYAAGPAIVKNLKEMGFKIFIDLKLHDIPHQVAGAAASLVRAGADMLTLHCSGGMAMLQACEQATTNTASYLGIDKPITLGITVLTSLDDSDLASIGVLAANSETSGSGIVLGQTLRLAQLAKMAGLSGVVASPREASSLRQLLGSDAAIVTPGVRPLGAETADQKRITTPTQALAAGASHLVIGRPITAAQDPVAAFEAIVTEIANQSK